MFGGKVFTERMRECYPDADICLNSPTRGKMPNSVIEAFAAGLPVVSTDAGGIPYVVRHGDIGFLSRCDDHESLGGQMLELLREPGLAAAVSARARRESLTRYVWPAVAVEWKRLYRDLTQLTA